MKLNLIPQPKKAELLGHVFLRPGAVTADAFFESAAETFMDFRARLFGAVSDGVPVTLLRKEGLPRGGYTLDSRMSGITRDSMSDDAFTASTPISASTIPSPRTALIGAFR